MEIYTIGVYNSTEQEFFNKLVENEIDTFCDIRQRRGVRGKEYTFVNSKKLQDKLEKLGINYVYIPELAPTKEIREAQKLEDARQKILKRDRNTLGSIFVREYNRLIESFDFIGLHIRLESLGCKKVVFFCVEENPNACHRSIVAKRMVEKRSENYLNL